MSGRGARNMSALAGDGASASDVTLLSRPRRSTIDNMHVGELGVFGRVWCRWYPSTLLVRRRGYCFRLLLTASPSTDCSALENGETSYRYSQAIHRQSDRSSNESGAQRSRNDRTSKGLPTLGGRKIYCYVDCKRKSKHHETAKMEA